MNMNKNELINLTNERSKVYSKAKYSINCDNLSKNKVVKKIIDIYEAN